MTNIPNIDFNKVTDKDNTLFNQTQYYEGNFDKINQQVVPKVNELDNSMGEAEGRLELAEADLDDHEGRIGDIELGKVDKVTGKGLSTNDFTDADKEKIDVTIPAQLAEKVKNFKLKNEVVNGDFSQGDSVWFSQNSSSVASGNKLTNTANGTAVYGRIYADFNVKPLAGEKIYYRYILKPLSAEIIESICLLRDGTGSITNTTKFTGFVVNQEKIISNLQTIPSNYLNAIRMYVSHEYPSSAVANGKSADFTKITLIRLTNIFGAGNEPTKVEMDELIKIIPNGWWDGELTLTQKQVITWQLNLIRKNTNAIIALGGTII